MKEKEGWTWLFNAYKQHYFVDKKSLCGKWAILLDNELEIGNDESPDNCLECRRKLKKRKEKKYDTHKTNFN